MSMPNYVVTGHMASFDTMTSDGFRRATFYRGSPVPADVSPASIQHHLDVGLIAEVPGSDPVGMDSAGAVVAGDDRIGEGVTGEAGEAFLGANTISDEQAQNRGLTELNARLEPVTTDGAESSGAAAKGGTMPFTEGVTLGDPAQQVASEPGTSEATPAETAAESSSTGEAPDGRASKAAHVEFLASRGFDRAELEKQDKATLVDMTKQQSA